MAAKPRTTTKRKSGNGKKGPLAGNGQRTAAVQQLAGTLVGRMRMLEHAGLQFQGKRDLYAAAGYIRNPTFHDYYGYYCRDGIAHRLIEIEPRTTWRESPEIVEDGKTDTAFVEAFNDLAKRLDLWAEFERIDRLSGIGQYGVLLIGTRADDLALRQPLRPLSGPDDVQYVRAYHEGHAQIRTWVERTADKRFGLPETYQLTLSDAPGFTKTGLRVHASHVLHVAEDADDRVYGRPRLMPVFNRIFDLDKIAASTAESYWQAVARILQAKIDPAALLGEDELDVFEDKMAEMVHDLRREFIAKGVTMEWLTAQTSPVKDIGDFYFALIAIGRGIPRRILFGNEVGELASSTDQATWFGVIAERQRRFAEPQLVRAFISRMVELNALPAPEGEYDVVWPELFKLTELEQAQANAARVSQAVGLAGAGGDPLALVEIDEQRNVWLTPREPGDPLPEPVWPTAPELPPGPPLPEGMDGELGEPPAGAEQFAPDQPRDESGRWTDTGRVSDMASRITERGGFTYNPRQRSFPRQGYAVSPYKGRERVGGLPDSRAALKDHLRAYIAAQRDLARRRGHHLGAWVENGKLFLDVSVVTRNSREVATLARRHRQLAYFDLKRGETVHVKRAA